MKWLNLVLLFFAFGGAAFAVIDKDYQMGLLFVIYGELIYMQLNKDDSE